MQGKLALERVRDGALVSTVFFSPISTSLQSISIVILLLSVLFNADDRQSLHSLSRSTLGGVTIVFFLLIGLSMLWTVAPLKEAFGVVGKYTKLVCLFFFIVACPSAYIKKITIHAFLVAMLITCILSFLKSFGWCHYHGVDDPGWVFRNHIITAYMMAFAAYLSIYFGFNSNHLALKCTYGVLFILFSYQLLFINMGRTGYLIYFLLISLAIMFLCPLKKAMGLIFSVVLMAGLVYLNSDIMQQRVSETIYNIQAYKKNEDKNTPVGLRLQFHAFSKHLFEERPWLGWGAGGFEAMYAKRQPVVDHPTLFEPHSQYWLTLVEQGSVGLFFLLFYFLTLGRVLWVQGGANRFMGIGMLLSFLLGSFSDSLLLYSSTGYFFLLFIALSLPLSYFKR